MTATLPEIDTADLRRTLGAFASGVVAVTAIADGLPVGMVCQSFTSLSLEPPLVCLCPGNASTSWPKIRSAGRFAVSVLADGQEDVCRSLAGPEKFAGVGWTPGGSGAPLIDGALAWIECVLDREVPGGDHTIAIGRVTSLALAEAGAPLLFYRSAFTRLADAS